MLSLRVGAFMNDNESFCVQLECKLVRFEICFDIDLVNQQAIIVQPQIVMMLVGSRQGRGRGSCQDRMCMRNSIVLLFFTGEENI